MGCYVNSVAMVYRATPDTGSPDWSLMKKTVQEPNEEKTGNKRANLNKGDVSEIYNDCSDVEVKKERENNL